MAVPQGFFLAGDLNAFAFYVQANSGEKAHVYVRNPNEGETRDEITAPIRKYQFESRDEKKKRRYPMAKTVLTCKKVEKLSLQKGPAFLAMFFAPFAGFVE
ncbi:MAG TPA: hypothetical protein VN881_11585 [Candidatus Acidoferrales bacterium]|nr:hypothetical protein [Candidatus Acidoferrales bacterium]